MQLVTAMTKFRSCLIFAAVASAVALSGCKKVNGDAYALTSGGKIIAFSVNKPTKITNTVSLSGLPLDTTTGQASESIVQMDYRPADQQLYGITSANHVYLINPDTGAVTAVGTGESFSDSTLANPRIDFDPSADILRVISSDQNLQVTPSTGALINSGTRVLYASGGTNASSTPALTGIAYSYDGSPTLYALDASTQSLVTVGSRSGSPLSPDSGVLYTVGSLGVSFGTSGGFDIQRSSGTAFAALSTSGGGASLYTVDLGKGSASFLGLIGDGSQSIISMAVAPGS